MHHVILSWERAWRCQWNCRGQWRRGWRRGTRWSRTASLSYRKDDPCLNEYQITAFNYTPFVLLRLRGPSPSRFARCFFVADGIFEDDRAGPSWCPVPVLLIGCSGVALRLTGDGKNFCAIGDNPQLEAWNFPKSIVRNKLCALQKLFKYSPWTWRELTESLWR